MSIETRRHYSAARMALVAHMAIIMAILLDAHAAYTLAQTGASFRLPLIGWEIDWGGVVGVALVAVFLYFRAGTSGLADKADNNRQYGLAGQIRRTNRLLSSISFLMLFSAIYMQAELANDRTRAASAPVKLAQIQYDEAKAAYQTTASRYGQSANAAAAAEADGIRAQAAAGREQAKAAFIAWLGQDALNAQGAKSGKTIGQILSQSCFVMSDTYAKLASLYEAECKRHRAATRGEVDGATSERLAQLDASASGARAIANAREEMAHAERELLRAKAAAKGQGGEYYAAFALMSRLTGINPESIMTVFSLLVAVCIVAISSAAPGCATLVGETDQRNGPARRSPGLIDIGRDWLRAQIAQAQANRSQPAHFAPPREFATGAGKPATRAEMYRQWMSENPGATRADCARHFDIHPSQITRAFSK